MKNVSYHKRFGPDGTVYEILKNMALLLMTQECAKNRIDCSGTYCVKAKPRFFVYHLVDDATGQNVIASITFHKSSVPSLWLNSDYRK